MRFQNQNFKYNSMCPEEKNEVRTSSNMPKLILLPITFNFFQHKKLHQLSQKVRFIRSPTHTIAGYFSSDYRPHTEWSTFYKFLRQSLTVPFPNFENFIRVTLRFKKNVFTEEKRAFSSQRISFGFFGNMQFLEGFFFSKRVFSLFSVFQCFQF